MMLWVYCGLDGLVFFGVFDGIGNFVGCCQLDVGLYFVSVGIEDIVIMIGIVGMGFVVYEVMNFVVYVCFFFDVLSLVWIG